MRHSAVTSTLGVSRRRASELLDGGRLVRLGRGFVVGGCVAERAVTDADARHTIALHQLLMTYGDAVASHDSAALLHGLPLLDWSGRAIATRARGAWRGGPTSRVRIAPLPAPHVTRVEDWPCTSVARTVVDLARCGTFRAAVAAGDAAAARGTSVTELSAMREECSSWGETRKAQQVIGFVDPRSESALESASRAVMHERGLPPPEIQVRLVGADGVRYRVDFFWRQFGVIGEADGLVKYDGIDAVRSEKLRQEQLERAGFVIVRWTFREMLVETEATMRRLALRLR
jgi:Protein of unknown function (DUF559)